MSSIWGIGPDALTGGRNAYFRPDPINAFLDAIVPFRLTSKKQKHKFIAEKLIELCDEKPTIKRARKQWDKAQIKLDDYCPYRPVEDVALYDASPKQIEVEMQQRIKEQPLRIKELQRLVAPWGIELDYNLNTLDALELWFCTYLHLFTKREFLDHLKIAGKDKGKFHLAPPIWYSIVLDISLYIFAMLKKDLPDIGWGVGRGNRISLLCSDNPEDGIEFESELWLNMITLHHHHIPNRFFDDLRRHYKKAAKRCQNHLNKSTYHTSRTQI
jgi:hypothetical protein